MLSKSDLKQTRLIEKKISQFEKNKLNLFDFVCDLGGLLNILESVPNTWKNDFQVEVNNLNLISDSIEDGSISRWEGNFEEELNESTSKLKNMTTCLIDEYLRKPDPNVIESAIKASSNWLICPKCTDAWESYSRYSLVICPKCECAFNNPLANQT